MSRVRTFSTFTCPAGAHELATFPTAQVWCIRRDQHPTGHRGPIAMTPTTSDLSFETSE